MPLPTSLPPNHSPLYAPVLLGSVLNLHQLLGLACGYSASGVEQASLLALPTYVMS